MSATVDCFINVTDGKLMRYFGGGSNVDFQPFKFPAVTDYDSFTVRVCVLRRTSGGFKPTFAIVPGPTIAIAAGVRGTTPAVLTTSFTTDGDFQSGTVNFATAAFQSLVAAGTPVYIAFKVNDREVVQQLLETSKANITSGATLPTPAEDFYNKTEADQRFLKLDADAGQTVVLKSANGSWGRELGVDDTGNPIDRVIQI
jgi:hypothetical protein